MQTKLDSLEFILDVDNWPRWPVLPLKKRTAIGFPHSAVLGVQSMERHPEKFVLWEHKSIFEELPIKDAKIVTAQEVVDAGWEVD